MQKPPEQTTVYVVPNMPDWEELLLDLYYETYEIDTDEDDEEIGADWDLMRDYDLDDDDDDDDADEDGVSEADC